MSAREALIEALGDLNDYRFTGWIYDIHYDDWHTQWNCIDESAPDNNIPEASHYCHCGTEIRYHYLIQHKKTHQRAFVGSICYNHFASLRKTCPDCNKFHLAKKSLHCQNCRKICHICKKFHSSNISHEPMILKFGKHKNEAISDLVQSDPKYLLFLGEQAWVDDTMIERIQMVIDSVVLPFGKHSNKSIGQIRKDDEGYVKYLFRQSRLH